MAIQITIDSIVSGTSPYNVWVCDGCGTSASCQYINTFSTSAFTFTLPTVFETYPAYYVKIIDSNNCVYCISPSISACNVFIGYWDGNVYYKYNVVSDTEEGPLTLPITPSVDDSLMANSDNKLWFLTNTGTTELNMVVSPFSATYSRDIKINLSSVKQLYSVDNSNLIVCATNTATTRTYIHNAVITGTTAQTTSLLEVVGSLSGDTTIKDMKLSTEDKIIILGKTGSTEFLQQYDYVSGGTLELEINLSGITNPATFIQSNDLIYILTQSNQIYQINLTSPYLLTYIADSTTPIGFGRASQRYGCLTKKFVV